VGEAVRRSRFVTGLAAYAGFRDYFDYYDRTRAYIRGGWAFQQWFLPAGPMGVHLTLSREDHRSAEKNDDYEGFLQRFVQPENPAADEGRLTSLTLTGFVGDERLSGTRAAMYAGTQVEAARSDVLGSDFGFIRWSGALAFRIPTFLPRRSRPATLRVDFFAGAGSKTTPTQREGYLDSAVGPLAPGAGFRASKGRLPLSRKWIALFWQHDFGSALAEWLGLGERMAEIGVFGGHARASGDPLSWRHELGLALTYPFGLPIRLYVASPLDRWRPEATLSIRRSH
jgi:hypothetical protein